MVQGSDDITALNRQLEKEFEHLMAQLDVPLTDDQKAVAKAFFETEQHISPDKLLKKVKSNGHDISAKDVMTVLEMLEKNGFAKRREFDSRMTMYEHRHLSEHHDHMVCVKCGKIMEFYNQALEEGKRQVAREQGFHPLYHKLEVYGICPSCMGKRDRVMPLTMAAPRERVIIRDFAGGPWMAHRLAEMGLTTGSEIEIVSNEGRMILSVRGSRFAVGRGMASKIMVTIENNGG